MIKLAGVQFDSLMDGPGLRLVFFMPGCIHACPECHNPEIQDPKRYSEYTDQQVKDLIDISGGSTFIDGITISGGDPVFNSKNTLELLELISTNYPGINIWMYTGYLIHEVPMTLLEHVDVIVDGKYIKELPKGLYIGSDNQCIWRKNEKCFEDERRSKKFYQETKEYSG